MLKTESQITVRYVETDNMGVVHHSNYPIWFEVGRTDFTKELGLPYAEMEQLGLMFPLIHLTCTYKFPARYGDTVSVISSIKELSSTRIHFDYSVLRLPDEKLLCTGTSEHVWTDDKLKPVNVKRYRPEIFQRFEQVLNLEDA